MKKLTATFFLVYVLLMLTAEWWPFDFHFPAGSAYKIESFNPKLDRYRWQLEKDVLKFALFIPLGFLLTLLPGSSPQKWRTVAQAVLAGAGLGIFIEAGRWFLPGRYVETADVIMGTGGTLLGAMTIYLAGFSRRTLALLTMVCALGFVMAATWPYRFSLQAASPGALRERMEWSPFSGTLSFQALKERALNGLMMTPLGLLAASYALRTLPARQAMIFTTKLGFCSSLTVELLQCFLPNRTPSVSDVTLNTLGTLLGGLLILYRHRAQGESGKGISIRR
jgi:glycopeptide antibiotics resistance protein